MKKLLRVVVLMVGVGLILSNCSEKKQGGDQSGGGGQDAGAGGNAGGGSASASAVPFADLAVKTASGCSSKLFSDPKMLGCFRPQQEAAGNNSPVAFVNATNTNISSGQWLLLYGNPEKVKLIISSDDDAVDWSAARDDLASIPPPHDCPQGFAQAGVFKPEPAAVEQASAKVRGNNITPSLRSGWLALCVQSTSTTGFYVYSIEGKDGHTTTNIGHCPDPAMKEVARFKPDSLKGDEVLYSCEADGRWNPKTAHEPCATAVIDNKQFFAGWILLCEEQVTPAAPAPGGS